MTCYREIKPDPDEPFNFDDGPEVECDYNHVAMIADNAKAFALHVRPRYYKGRDRDFGKDE